jgi:hypothetical protein
VWSGPRLASLCRLWERAEARSTAGPLTAPLLRGVRGSPAPRKPTVGRPRESGGPCSHDEVLLTSHLQRSAGLGRARAAHQELGAHLIPATTSLSASCTFAPCFLWLAQPFAWLHGVPLRFLPSRGWSPVVPADTACPVTPVLPPNGAPSPSRCSDLHAWFSPYAWRLRWLHRRRGAPGRRASTELRVLRRVQAKGHAQHSLCAEPWSRFAGPGSWAGTRTWRLGSGARLGSLCRSRDEQRLYQRRAPSPLHPSNVVGPPTTHKLSVGRPRESGGPCSHDEFLLTSHLQRPAGSKALAPLNGSLALTSSPEPLR